MEVFKRSVIIKAQTNFIRIVSYQHLVFLHQRQMGENRLKVLFLGDVVGKSGCDFVARHLGSIKKTYGVDACIINGENSAEGNGITPDSARMLFDAGADVITTGNHVLKRKEIFPKLDEQNGIIRPANYHYSAPGAGVFVLDKLRWQLCVINLQGQAGMEPCGNPFEKIDQLLQELPYKNILVDFHAEMTSEKKAMGYYLDGRVSAVLGTHTHVQTADERILPKGTAYITDAGMCGGKNSVLGVKKEIIIQKFLTNLPARFEYDHQDMELNAVLIEIDNASGKAQDIQRIRIEE